MKNFLLKKMAIPCVILMLVICMIFSGCASRRSVSAEEFSAACESAGFTLEDSSSLFDSSFVSAALLYNEGECSIGYYSFAKAADAKSYYAQYFSGVYAGTSEEKFIDSTEYNRYIVSTDSGLVLLYRNGNNLIYLAGPDGESLNAIVEELGI